ncbi:MAG: hypothetical protein ACI80V_001550 [Rhodothermales bacterium]|jgi:hypothetical protein
MKPLAILLPLLLLALPVAAQSITGSLGAADPTRGSGELYDVHTFQLDGPQQVTVRMESANFDTFLIVRSPSGIESTNDDFESQSVSQLEIWATESGEWTVWASQYSSEGMGAYSLSIQRGASAEVSVIQGRLDYADQVALKGEYFDTHSWDVPPASSVIVELLSLGFDGYLVVTSPTGEITRNDDSDSGSTSLSRVGPLSGGGKWRVDVTSNSPAEMGAYDLRLITIPSQN